MRPCHELFASLKQIFQEKLDKLYLYAHEKERPEEMRKPGVNPRRTFSYDYYHKLKLLRYRLMLSHAAEAAAIWFASLLVFMVAAFFVLRQGSDSTLSNVIPFFTGFIFLLFIYLFIALENHADDTPQSGAIKEFIIPPSVLALFFAFLLFIYMLLVASYTNYINDYYIRSVLWKQLILCLGAGGSIYFLRNKTFFKYVLLSIITLFMSFYPLIAEICTTDKKNGFTLCDLLLVRITRYFSSVTLPRFRVNDLLLSGFVSTLVIWLILVYLLVPIAIIFKKPQGKKKIAARERIFRNPVRFFLYWQYFLGACFTSNLATIVGITGFFAFALLSGTFLKYHDGTLGFEIWGYASAFFASMMIAFQPILSALRDIRQLFIATFNKHTERILNHLSNHLVIVGVNNLGRSAIRSTFTLVHGGEFYIFGEQPRGFCLYIDSRLEICIASERVIAVDEDENKFVITDNTMNDYSLGLFKPFSDDAKIYIIGICGKSDHPSVIQAVRMDEADLLVSTLNNYHENMLLARLENPHKKVLSYANASSFNAILNHGFGKPVFAFNANLIEGISISQKVIQYMMKELAGVTARNQDHGVNIRDLKKIKPVLLAGDYQLIYEILHALVLAWESQTLNTELTKEFLQNKVIVFMKDVKIEEEIEDSAYENAIWGFKDWVFYPERREGTRERADQYRVKISNHEPNNYETFKQAFMQLIIPDLWPGLIVFLKDKEHDTVEMIDRGLNALISCVNEHNLLPPQVLASCNHLDRTLVSSQLQRYLLFNRKLTHNIWEQRTTRRSNPNPMAYPSLHPKDSLLNWGMVAGNQLGTLIDALFDTHSPEDEAFVNFITSQGDKYDAVANLSYCLDDQPGALMLLLAELHQWSIVPHKDFGGVPKPSFCFCYTFNDLHVEKQFVFTGTANMRAGKECNQIEAHSARDLVNAWSVDCEHPPLEEGARPASERDTDSEVMDSKTLVQKILDLNKSFCNAGHTRDDCRHSRQNSDCTISNYSQNSYQYTALDKENKYYWRACECMQEGQRNGNSGANAKDCSPGKYGKNPDEKVHFKLWAGPTDCPGTLAKGLVDLMMYEINTEKLKPGTFVPSIEFCTSIPCGATDAALVDIYTRFVNFDDRKTHSKLKVLEYYNALIQNQKAPINAIKIKFSRMVTATNRSSWLDYMTYLVEFLNSIYNAENAVDKPHFSLYLAKHYLSAGELKIAVYSPTGSTPPPFGSFTINNQTPFNIESNLFCQIMGATPFGMILPYSEILVVNELFMNGRRDEFLNDRELLKKEKQESTHAISNQRTRPRKTDNKTKKLKSELHQREAERENRWLKLVSL